MSENFAKTVLVLNTNNVIDMSYLFHGCDSLIDLDRPKLCADRIDSIFMNNLVWLQNTDLEEIRSIYENIVTNINEDGKREYSLIDLGISDRLVELESFVNKEISSTKDSLIKAEHKLIYFI